MKIEHTPDPPEAWSPAFNAVRAAAAPIERFLRVETAGGILLIAAAVIALAWANSPWHASYDALWHTEIGLRVGRWEAQASLHFLIDEGLMTLFFFVVGLEIRREIHHGELSRLKSAALPLAAALGGMLVPAGIFTAFNGAGANAAAWGVPMATDIAFAVGVLTLLGKRVPAALRVMLLALAIIDDIGAIVVIAVFFSKGLSVVGIAVSLLAVLSILLLQRFGARRPLLYVLPTAGLWLGLAKMGIHPTIAGVVAGLLTPTRAWFGPERFANVARAAAAGVEGGEDAQHVHEELARVGLARREALPPVTRLQHLLHPWVSFVVMPLFALANAGISVEGIDTGDRDLALGVILGLVVGKPIGIVLGSFVVVKTRLASLPTAVTWRGVVVVGLVGAIGFTMAIFMAGLALASPAALATAKFCVLIASAVAAASALAFGRLALRRVDACSAEEAEASSVD